MTLLIELVDKKYFELKGTPLGELKTLPGNSSIEITEAGSCYTIGIWRDDLRDGTTNIVVQGYSPGWLGKGHMYARGFKMTSNGEFHDLAVGDLYEFS